MPETYKIPNEVKGISERKGANNKIYYLFESGSGYSVYGMASYLIEKHYFPNDTETAGTVLSSEARDVLRRKIKEHNPGKINGNYILPTVTEIDIPDINEFFKISGYERRTGVIDSPIEVESNSIKSLYIAITIDDGPSLKKPSFANEFYSDLSAKSIKATWFIQYYKLKRYGTEWIPFYLRLQNEGYEIGVHSYYYSARLTDERNKDLITENDHISWVTGGSSGAPQRFKTFEASFQAAQTCLIDLKNMGFNITYGRPPGGRASELSYLQSESSKKDFDLLLDRFSTELKFVVWPGSLGEKWLEDWTVMLDHDDKFGEKFKQDFVAGVNKRKYAIILTHDNNDGSLPELRKGIEWIKNTYSRDYDIKYLTLTGLAVSYNTMMNQALRLPPPGN